jgi:hypothetical protein
MGIPSGEVAVPETVPWEPALAGGDSAMRATARPSVVFIESSFASACHRRRQHFRKLAHTHILVWSA